MPSFTKSIVKYFKVRVVVLIPLHNFERVNSKRKISSYERSQTAVEFPFARRSVAPFADRISSLFLLPSYFFYVTLSGVNVLCFVRYACKFRGHSVGGSRTKGTSTAAESSTLLHWKSRYFTLSKYICFSVSFPIFK